MADYSRFMRQANLIGGEWVSADDGTTIAVENPATGEVIGHIPKCGAAETYRAIAAAQRAFESYRETTANERSVMLRHLHDALMDHQQSLAELLTTEQGKPLAEAKGEIAIGAAYVLWYAEEIRRTYGEIVPSPVKDRRLLVTKHPTGVVGAITPWNFPSSMLARKLGPALAAGCTVVVKPATVTPYSALAWGVLAEDAGFPAGAVNILTGSAREIGGEIMSNPLVKKVTFTGSTEVGKTLIRQSADTVKKISMELGGNAPFIVFDDADVDRAVEGAIASKFRNSGQTCVCTNRFYVQEGIYDAFLAKLKVATEALKVGNGLEDGTQQGPLIDTASISKMEDLMKDAEAKGGRVVTGGKRHALGGQFFAPTIIAEANDTMHLTKEEIFGPIAPIFKFNTEEQAIAKANDTEFGLAAYAYTQDLGRAFRLNEKLEYGLIGINEGIITTVEAPFGGLKESGLGKEGGHQGIDDYLDTKYTAIGGLNL
ncbi:NAD-dependent succinate-semialdehyde dehydrogenase [Pseudovibrio exalbescens]|uniref:NAD-dependent succinate-semialdehyde dehydrogenase n=1 Tax=Pseudovibrio exalbescens TaxID=197461 RepID=UPI0023653B42|nr:NAD-dependent succinate-semialdehyde dehydrogenase [Pseudovibrio exalbescens]MDD7910758.1 NAD-dependent succinate-semialdehyde dehydrogenase [Pseudovibrio exalbescens]